MTKTVAAGQTFGLRGTLGVGHILVADSGSPAYLAGAYITVHTSAVNQGTIDLLAGPGYRDLNGATGATLRVTGTLTNSQLINAAGGLDASGHRGAVGGAAVEIGHTGSVLNTGTILLGGAVGYSYYNRHDGPTTGAILRDNGTLANIGTLRIAGSDVPSNSAGATAVVAGLLANYGMVDIGSATGIHNGRGGVLRITGIGTILNNGTISVGPYGGENYKDAAGAATFQIAGQLTNNGFLDDSSGASLGDGHGALITIGNTGSVTNAGSISISAAFGFLFAYEGSTAATLSNNGVLTNHGLITDGGVMLANGVTTNDGTLEICGEYSGYPIQVAAGLLDLSGTLSNAGVVEVSAGNSAYSPSFVFSEGGTLTDAGVVNNSGTILVEGASNGRHSGNAGGSLIVTGVLTNAGQIEVSHGIDRYYQYGAAVVQISGTLANLGTLDCSGTLQGYKGESGTVTISASGLLIDPGALTGTGTLDNAGTLSSGATGLTTGTLNLQLLNTGTVDIAANGAFAIDGTISGFGQISIAAGGLLTLSAAVDYGQTVDFAGTYSTLALADPAAFYATVEGLRPQTTIDFLNTAVSTASATGTTLAIGLVAGGTLDFTLAAPLPSYATLSLSNDLHGGTNLAVTDNSADLLDSSHLSKVSTPSLASLPGSPVHFEVSSVNHGIF